MRSFAVWVVTGFILGVLGAAGCSPLPLPVRPATRPVAEYAAALVSGPFSAEDDRCDAANARYASWGAVGASASVLAGVSGLAGAAGGDDKRLRLGLGLASIGFSAVAAGAMFVRDASARELATYCMQPESGVSAP